MSMLDKQALINAITLRLAEDYDLKISEVKDKLIQLMTQYHVTISDESFCGENLTTEYLWKKFADGKRAIGMNEITLCQYKVAVNSFEKYSGTTLGNAEAEDINRWLKLYSKDVSSVTVKGKYQLLSSVYTYLSERRYIPHNPIAYTETPKAEVIYKKPLSDSELESIKHACENLKDKNESLRDMALIHTFISTGCRVSELAHLKISSVDLDKKTCIVLGKGNKERIVVLSDKAVYRLNLYLSTRKDLNPSAPLFAHLRGKEKELTKDGIELIIKKLRTIADVPNLTCHVFRRFYATELRKRNVPIQMIATSLGHANLNQINRYSLFSTTEMTNTIRNVI